MVTGLLSLVFNSCSITIPDSFLSVGGSGALAGPFLTLPSPELWLWREIHIKLVFNSVDNVIRILLRVCIFMRMNGPLLWKSIRISFPISLWQIYALWIDPNNYVEVTRHWHAKNISFPLNFFLPDRMQCQHLERVRLMRGNSTLEAGEEAEKEVWRHGIMGWRGRVWGLRLWEWECEI